MKLLHLFLVISIYCNTSALLAQKVEQYSMYEISMNGPSTGNPFVDVKLSAVLKYKNYEYFVEGFYDGNGIFKLRFMPDSIGEWIYVTKSNSKAMHDKKGKFTCVAAGKNNRGMVHVRDTFHFGYSDGTPFYPQGTTCYAWVHQPDSLVALTLKTLSENSFNKIRMTVMPKHYSVYINNEPPFYPFEGSKTEGWNFYKPNIQFFRNLEQKIESLMKLGIEADLILFHPYDYEKWGFDKMNPQEAVFYLRYLIARIAAYRNVWWAMANEYDLMNKSEQEWELYCKTVKQYDPYRHLLSIHNGQSWYNHSEPWISHLSIQTPYLQDIQKWREKYNKPVIIDECVYEGNVPADWGHLTPQEMTNRFWITWTRGGYCTHGETYLHPQNILWWAKGGRLYGQSQKRIAFMLDIMKDSPTKGLTPLHNEWNKETYLFKTNEYYLFYYGNSQQAQAMLYLPKNINFSVEIIDTWNMTITPIQGKFNGTTIIDLPGLPYLAVRAKRSY